MSRHRNLAAHQPLQHDAAPFDAKCLACHSAANAKSATAAKRPATAAPAAPGESRIGKPRPLAKAKCVACHMPKINVILSDFIDHRIRIVRKGEPYPE